MHLAPREDLPGAPQEQREQLELAPRQLEVAPAAVRDGGRDRIVAGGGRDVVAAGAGNDVVGVRGGGADQVSCGPGADVVRADRRDRVAADCETIRK
ncbi:MAG TPA: hypothetical protein VHF89_06140 [Solirubrobacteraceae bacterium]|nr:hypothetical protein [Solirubrobacteraceae bacterium]